MGIFLWIVLVNFVDLSCCFISTGIAGNRLSFMPSHTVGQNVKAWSEAFAPSQVEVRKAAWRRDRLFMGRFDMEKPYHPEDHICFEQVNPSNRPTLTGFLASENKDQDIVLLFSSISSALKSISSLTRQFLSIFALFVTRRFCESLCI